MKKIEKLVAKKNEYYYTNIKEKIMGQLFDATGVAAKKAYFQTNGTFDARIKIISIIKD